MARPTKYRKEYCEKIIEFFDREPWENKVETTVRNGQLIKTTIKEPCRFPTFERFAFEIGVHRDTLRDWCEVHPEFLSAYKKAKDLQKEVLIQNGMAGLYDKTFAIFTAKNVTDMRDKVQTEVTHKETVKIEYVDSGPAPTAPEENPTE